MKKLLFIFMLLSPVAWTAQTEVSSLPWSSTQDWDTVTFSGNLTHSSARTAMFISHDHVFIQGDGDTLWINAHDSINIYGFLISGDTAIVENLTVIEYDSLGNNCQLFRVGGNYGTTLRDCNVHVKSPNSRAYYAQDGYDHEIDGGNWTSYVRNYTRRDFDSAKVIVIGDQWTVENVDDYDNFTARVHNITIDICPHGGVEVWGLVHVDSNNITVDACNDQYDSLTAGEYESTDNAYAIAVDDILYGSTVMYNTVRSGTDDEGGRGIYVGDPLPTTTGGCVIAYNDIDVHRGPSPALKQATFTIGIKVRAYADCDSLIIHNNMIVARADNWDATEHTCRGAFALNMDGMIRNAQIYNNNITVIADTVAGGYEDNLEYGRPWTFCCAIDTAEIYGHFNFYDNHWLSNCISVRFGDPNTGFQGYKWSTAHDFTFTSDTVELFTPSYTDDYNVKGAIVVVSTARTDDDNVFCDPLFMGDSSITHMSGTGIEEVTWQEILVITVKGSDSVAVSSANVWIINNYTDTMFTGITNENGQIVDTFSYDYDHWSNNVHTDSTFSPFTLKAKKSDDSTSNTMDISWSTNDTTLVLANTVSGMFIQGNIPIRGGVSIQ